MNVTVGLIAGNPRSHLIGDGVDAAGVANIGAFVNHLSPPISFLGADRHSGHIDIASAYKITVVEDVDIVAGIHGALVIGSRKLGGNGCETDGAGERDGAGGRVDGGHIGVGRGVEVRWGGVAGGVGNGGFSESGARVDIIGRCRGTKGESAGTVGTAALIELDIGAVVTDDGGDIFIGSLRDVGESQWNRGVVVERGDRHGCSIGAGEGAVHALGDAELLDGDGDIGGTIPAEGFVEGNDTPSRGFVIFATETAFLGLCDSTQTCSIITFNKAGGGRRDKDHVDVADDIERKRSDVLEGNTVDGAC